MRVLMISDVYFPRINGVSTSIETFRTELQALGHEVTLVSPDYGKVFVDDKDTVRVPGRALIMDPEDRMMRWKRLNQILEQLRPKAFDIVHIQTPFLAHYAGTRVARRWSLPCVESYHTFFEAYLQHYVSAAPSWMLRFLARAFTRRQARAVDRLLVPSHAMREQLERYGVRTAIEVLPTGLTENDFAVVDTRSFAARHAVDENRPTVVHVGRIAFEKNIEFLIEAMARVRQRLPNLLFLVAGEGPALESIRNLCANRKLLSNTRFMGYLSRNGELQACYRSGDVFVFASRTETQGLVLLEALAAGTPVVSTAAMGTRDVLEGVRGALVAEEDIEDFADKVVRVLEDGGLRDRLSLEAAESAREWTAHTFAVRLQAIYRQLCDEHGSGRNRPS
jgi:glycosyltransferase involved in cell wall biosynthesis